MCPGASSLWNGGTTRHGLPGTSAIRLSTGMHRGEGCIDMAVFWCLEGWHLSMFPINCQKHVDKEIVKFQMRSPYRRKGTVRFNGGRMPPDAGDLALREVNRIPGLGGQD